MMHTVVLITLVILKFLGVGDSWMEILILELTDKLMEISLAEAMVAKNISQKITKR